MERGVREEETEVVWAIDGEGKLSSAWKLEFEVPMGWSRRFDSTVLSSCMF